MKLDYFEIQFDQPGGRFYAGQAVLGHLVVNTTQIYRVDRIEARMYGETHTGWVNKTSDVIYETNEPIVNDALDLTNFLTQFGGHQLPVGSHTIPFRFQLPANAPSTIFNEQYGWTRYTLMAAIHENRAHCTMPSFGGNTQTQTERGLQVLSVVSIAIPQLMQPSMIGDQVEAPGCCVTNGTVSAQIGIPRTAYIVGEPVDISLKLKNATGRKLGHQPTLDLCQRMDFSAQNRYELALCDRKEAIQTIESRPVPPATKNGADEQRQVQLFIPDTLQPTSATSAGSISVSYFIKLDMELFDLILPIVIGTTRGAPR